ncbi:MAG: hypothetical protein ACK4N5_10155, partial [Myxococcales bacterium]
FSARAAAVEPDPAPGNNEDGATVQVEPVADVALTAAATAQTVPAGEAVGFNISARNLGPSPASSVEVTLPLPAGASLQAGGNASWSCSTVSGSVRCAFNGSLPVGNAPALTVTLLAPTSGIEFFSTFRIDAAEGDPAPANDADTVRVGLTPSSDLALSVTPTPASVNARGNVAYAFKVTNGGPSPSTGMTLEMELPPDTEYVGATGAGWTCSEASRKVTCDSQTVLAVNAERAVTVTLRAPAQLGDFDFAGQLTGTAFDRSNANNRASATVSVNPVSDLHVAVSGAPALVGRGGAIVWTLTVGNAGPSDAESLEVRLTPGAGLTVSDVRAPGWSCTQAPFVCTRSELAVGASSAPLVDAQAPTTAGAVELLAAVSGKNADTTPGNDSARGRVVVGAPSLDNVQTFIVTTPTGAVAARGKLNVQVTVHNDGNFAAEDVEVALPIPAGTRAAGTHELPFKLGRIGAGESKPASFELEVLLDHPEALELRATVTADGLLPFERRASVPVLEGEPLTLTLAATPETIEPGEATTLKLALSGRELPAGAVVQVTLPADLPFEEGSVTLGDAAATASLENGVLRFELPEIGTGGLTAELKARASATAEGPQVVTAHVTRKGKPVSLEAQATVQIHTSYDLGGCGCGSSGSNAAGSGLLVLLAVALAARRPTRAPVRVRARRR